MLIGVSSAQGAGKTTLLNELKKLGHVVVERKTSRSILSDWNITLDEVNRNPDLTKRFQDEIILRKFNDELQYTEQYGSDTLIFTERTYADLMTYTTAAIGGLNEHSEWLNQYYEQCKTYQMSYDYVFYIQSGLFPIEHDGVRGSNVHYGKMVDLLLKYELDKMNNNFLEIVDKELDKRVQFILNNVKTIKGDYNNDE